MCHPQGRRRTHGTPMLRPVQDGRNVKPQYRDHRIREAADRANSEWIKLGGCLSSRVPDSSAWEPASIRAASGGEWRSESVTFLHPTLSGLVVPLITHPSRQGRYSSSRANPLLHLWHENTTGKSAGRRSSRRSLESACSRVVGSSPQKTQNAACHSSAKSFRWAINQPCRMRTFSIVVKSPKVDLRPKGTARNQQPGSQVP